eukprot:TRINITY_DN22719_c0_g2_i1.p1 TRINITY_DN22719_c0_g2~~TRINITY_DN22719_c0_g2_i1.p1  ORF type:complete len:386 (-),score=27.00 TRINITY_DN22719_c0_g2_i1:67-1224(-)
MSANREATSLWRTTLEYSADSVESVPFDDLFPNSSDFFVCGNYQLRDGERLGRVLLYQWLPNVPSDPECVQKQLIDTEAVLDLKWSYQKVEGQCVLGQVSAKGLVRCYSLSASESDSPSLQVCAEYQGPEKVLYLSTDFNNRVSPNVGCRMAASQSDGRLTLFDLQPTGLTPTAEWSGHEYEGWIVAFDSWQPQLLYSGADDCLLRGWDERTSFRSPLFTNSWHEAGVCSLQSSPHQPFLLASGSYDEKLRLWDTRYFKQPIVTYQLGGGVWRIKWHPVNPDLILTACMHNGFHVCQLSNPDHSTHCDTSNLDSNSSNNNTSGEEKSGYQHGQNVACELGSSYMEHQSLAYGVDWFIKPEADLRRSLIASCSFYDCALHVWKPQK